MGGIAQDEHPRLKVGKAGKLPEHQEDTPEKQARRRARANKPYIPTRLYFNEEATTDAIRHFA